MCLLSCNPPVIEPVIVPVKSTPLSTKIDGQTLQVIQHENAIWSWENIEDEILQLQDRFIITSIRHQVSDDSLVVAIRSMIEIPFPCVKINSVNVEQGSNTIDFVLDTAQIQQIIKPMIAAFSKPGDKPIYPLYTSSHQPPSTVELDGVSLLLPSDDAKIPSQFLLLPNAPRKYRNGIHRGIDFALNWGTPVRAVVEGTIIRSDLNFAEFDIGFRNHVLQSSLKAGHTPSDIFEHVLLGRSVYIDHGFDLIKGYRAVSIYAHLAHIDPAIKPGVKVQKGQHLGLSGNSGTEEAAMGNKGGAHLHWEMLLQNSSGEYYLGQGINNNLLYSLLNRIFMQ